MSHIANRHDFLYVLQWKFSLATLRRFDTNPNISFSNKNEIDVKPHMNNSLLRYLL